MIKTFTSSTIHPKLEELYTILYTKNKTKYSNYKIENCFTDYTLGSSVSLHNDEPYLGSVIWQRPFYEGMTRVMTRYCTNPESKIIHRPPNPRTDMVTMIDQQVSFCYDLGYKDLFFSKEDGSNGKNAKLILSFLNEHSIYHWKLSEKKRLVCPDPASKSCWQFIIYLNKDYTKECM